MTKRRALSKRVRFDIFQRDGFVCQYCGAQPPDVLLVVDHVVAVVNGGTDDPENLITACEPCNQGKSAKSLEASLPALDGSILALRAAQTRMEMRRFREQADAVDDEAREFAAYLVQKFPDYLVEHFAREFNNDLTPSIEFFQSLIHVHGHEAVYRATMRVIAMSHSDLFRSFNSRRYIDHWGDVEEHVLDEVKEAERYIAA